MALGFAANSASAKDPALLSLTMEHFRDTATVKDNLTDDTATISTENGFVEHTGPMRMVWNDEFLTGVIDKKTGRKAYQVNALIIYSGNLRSYETAGYQAANGPRTVPATHIRKEAAYCAVGDCTYTEYIAFPVDEELLRQVAAGRAPSKPDIWPYKLIAKSGPNYSGGLSNAEIAGFLAKIDEYTNAVPAVKSNAASASLKLDLGVNGMAVEASIEQPNRGGILITGVNRGSVAQKSGLIIGDILYEFDGHPMKTLVDLEAAVAGSAPNSPVAIRVYRGTDEMALTARF
jgi:PDZ domain